MMDSVGKNIKIMKLIIKCNSEIGAHVWNNLGYFDLFKAVV